MFLLKIKEAMERRKKGIFLLGISIIMSNFFIRTEVSQSLDEELLDSIHETYKSVFDMQNIIAIRWDNEQIDFDIWNALLAKIENFVSENAFDNKKLSKALIVCKQINKTIQSTAQGIFAVPLNQTVESIEKLRKSKDELQKQKMTLTKTNFYRHVEERNRARNVLIGLIEALESAIDKLSRDFEKDKQLFQSL